MEKLRTLLNRDQMGEITIDDDRQMGLVYDTAWSEAKGFAISPHLRTDVATSDSVKNFLANLLPEGEWLEELSIRTSCSKSNVFGLIASIGSETTGALTFYPDEDGDPTPTSFREIPRHELAERIAARKTTPITVWDEKPRLSVAGVQEKLPVLIRPDGVMGFGEGELASTHLLKFGKAPDLHLVLNEFLCMRLARAIGLPVANVEMARFGEPVLIVRRFDRRWQGDRVDRLHLIDGCQMLDLPPTYKYERPFGKGGHAAKIRTGANLPSLFKSCRLYCRVPAAAVRDMLNWMLFQLVIGNSDAHGKNISFFVGREGISPAPGYDFLNLDVYESSYDRDLAMAIGDCFNPDEVASFPMAEMCEECKLPQRQTARILQALCEKTQQALVALKLPELTTHEKEFAQKLSAKIAGNAVRLLNVAKELPKVRL